MARTLEKLSKLTPRVDALERVTGRARYTEDISLPGMLYARILRSPVPHARIRSIDTSVAEALPGVRAAIHSKNCEVVWSGGDEYGRRRLFSPTVLFVGDAVAVIAAEDRHTAEEALRLVRVDYEELPFILTLDQALQENTPPVHPQGKLDRMKGFYRWGNIQQGNVEEGLRQADAIYEGDFVTTHHNNAQLERRVSLANWDGERLTMWVTSQGVYYTRRDIATDLKLPLSKVRVICQYMGSGFGNKNQAFDYDLMAALLAQRTGQPVRVEMTRHEDFIGIHGRWATQQHLRIGYKKDGALTAIHVKNFSNMGAYLRSNGGVIGAQNYNAPHILSEIYRVHTNTTVAANYRAPSGPQGTFAMDQAMDEIAGKLGMDPLEFRMKNAVDKFSEEKPLSSNGIRDCMRLGAERFRWVEKRGEYAQQSGALRRGVGMALAGWHSGFGRSSAEIKLLPDGSVKLMVGVVDIGTGAKTTMCLIAAEALGVPVDNISIIHGDTDLAPFAPGEGGSQTTGSTGTAVIEAAKKVREQLLTRAARQFKVRPEDLELRDGKIVNLANNTANPAQSWPIAEVTSKDIDAITGSVTTDLPDEGGKSRMCFAAHFAEVEVNTETGKVRVLRYVAAHDSGTIVNKLTAGSQIKGGVAQGIGVALREELIWDQATGVPINNHYHGAKPVLHPEVPEAEVIFVETDDGMGPFGAKCLGEIPIVPVTGAIANAIFHATGVRMRRLPMTPDKLLSEFKKLDQTSERKSERV